MGSRCLGFFVAGIVLCSAASSVGAIDLRDAEDKSPVGVSGEQRNPALKLFTAGSPGSAVVIGKRGSLYTALTSGHVTKGNNASEIEVVLEDGHGEVVKSVQYPFPEIDLSVIRFHSNRKIPIAIFPFLDKKLWRLVDDWNYVAAAGFAVASEEVRQSPIRHVNGKILALMEGNPNGYNLLYDMTTNVGMSGSGIFTFKDFGKIDVVRYKTEAGMQYDYSDIPASDFKSLNAAQVYFSKKCAGMPSGSELEKSFKRNCKVFVQSAKSICDFSNPLNPSSYPLSQRLLLGIHGRSEKYTYGGKSGAGMGIFLGNKKIKNWLVGNAQEFGLAKELDFARHFCNQSRPYVKPHGIPGLPG